MKFYLSLFRFSYSILLSIFLFLHSPKSHFYRVRDTIRRWNIGGGKKIWCKTIAKATSHRKIATTLTMITMSNINIMLFIYATIAAQSIYFLKLNKSWNAPKLLFLIHTETRKWKNEWKKMNRKRDWDVQMSRNSFFSQQFPEIYVYTWCRW